MTRTDLGVVTTLYECSGTSFCPLTSVRTHPTFPQRDHDELRHSLRSVLHNFRPYTNHFRIVTTDLTYPVNSAEQFPVPGPGNWRLGLQPQWLETSENGTTEWRDGHVQLSLTHHASFFEPYTRSIFNRYARNSVSMSSAPLTRATNHIA